jgi:D-3-phosphoglycerate dehydrogenase
MNVLRWGRSAYETDADLELEASGLHQLGCRVGWSVDPAPDLTDVQILVVTSKVRVDAALLRSSSLELVITTTSGHEHIDLDAARALGIPVARCPEARRDAVVDTSVGMALSLLRDLPGLQSAAEAGVWARSELPARAPRQVRDQTVGVVGHGVIGQRAAQVWRALGATVLVHDPRFDSSVPLADLLARSSVVTLHCSLTPSSTWLLDRAELLALQPGTVVINTARGRSLRVSALADMTHLGGVGLDVFPVEPWPGLAELAQLANVLVTPHAAGFHPGLGRVVAREVTQTVAAWLAGDPLPHPCRVD